MMLVGIPSRPWNGPHLADDRSRIWRLDAKSVDDRQVWTFNWIECEGVPALLIIVPINGNPLSLEPPGDALFCGLARNQPGFELIVPSGSWNESRKRSTVA